MADPNPQDELMVEMGRANDTLAQIEKLLTRVVKHMTEEEHISEVIADDRPNFKDDPARRTPDHGVAEHLARIVGG